MGTINKEFGRIAGNLIGEMSINSPAVERPASRKKQLVGAYVALLLFMFIYCARPEDWVPGLSNAPLAKITGILAFLALLFSLPHVRQRFPKEISYLALLIGELFLASLLSPVWRGGAIQATLEFAKVLIAVIVMAMAANTLRRLRLLLLIQAASVTAIAAVTLWKGYSTQGRLEGMLGGNYSDPNDLALTFVLSIPLCLAMLFLTRSWVWKAVCALAILLMTYDIFLTGSRGGFLSLIITTAVCMWTFAIRGRRPYFLAVALLLGAILLMSSRGIVVDRLKGTFNPNADIAAAYSSSQQRQQLFWKSVEVTMEHPIFGVGPGNFGQLSGSWHVAHNSFTQMSAEGGFPALIFYVLILWRGFKNLRTTRRLAKGQRETILLMKALSASLVGYVVGSCFLSVCYTFFPYFLVGFTSALFLITERLATRSDPQDSISRESAYREPFAPLRGGIDAAVYGS
jgi:O-antigen ligase